MKKYFIVFVSVVLSCMMLLALVNCSEQESEISIPIEREIVNEKYGCVVFCGTQSMIDVAGIKIANASEAEK